MWWQCLFTVPKCPRELAMCHSFSITLIGNWRGSWESCSEKVDRINELPNPLTNGILLEEDNYEPGFMGASMLHTSYCIYCSSTQCWSQASKAGVWFVLRIQPYQMDLLSPTGCSWAAACWIRFLKFLLSLLINLTWPSFSLSSWKTSHLASSILFNWSLGSGFDDFSFNVYLPSIFYLIFSEITQLTECSRCAEHWGGAMIPEFLW